MRHIFILTLALLSVNVVFSQQDPHFTQYFDNTLFVNPAYAGSRGMLNVTGIHREQWVGIDGRPQSTTLSIHSPLVYENIGLGLTMVNDRVGPLQQTMFYGDFSYTLNFANSPGKLAFGLKGGINLLNVRTNELETTQDDDPSLFTNIQNNINPNFGFGVYYHTPKWFIGASTPKMLEASYDGTDGGAKERRHYFVHAGGVFNIARNWKLRPTTNLKYTVGAPLSIDLSLAGIYNEKVWLGLMTRFGDSFGAFVQYQITPQFKAGFAYDYTLTELTNYNSGTYELLLSYDFTFKKSGIRSPRYF